MITDYFTQSIVIQKVTNTDNGIGGYSEAWSTHITINGYIDLMSGNEQYKANKLNITATHILICDKGKDIVVNNRVSYNGIYRIKYVDTVFNHHMEIYLEYVGIDQ